MNKIIFNENGIFGIDTSQYNFELGSGYAVPDYTKAVNLGTKFIIVRTSYGQVTDKAFVISWINAKGKALRITYHYLDYFSHYMWDIGMDEDDVKWGKKQAQVAWSLVAEDNDGTIDFLDIEKASMAPKIEDDIYRVRRIASAYLTEMDRLSNRYNGLYLSLSYLKFFLCFKDRPLYLALYNRNYTPAQVVGLARAQGWVGPIYLWQFASDGDINGDGVGDGLKFGTQNRFLDLNVWLETEEKFLKFGTVGTNIPVTPKISKTKIVEIGRTLVNNQLLRASPYGTILSGQKLTAGKEVAILGYGKDYLGNPWVQLGVNQWAAQTFNGVKFIEQIML